jgi:hypothetical protein
MIKAARARPGAIYILERLLSDTTFGAILAPIVSSVLTHLIFLIPRTPPQPIDRMNILRGNIKRCAVNCVAAFYGLADLEPEQVKVRIEELLKDHRYIFSVASGTVSHSSCSTDTILDVA